MENYQVFTSEDINRIIETAWKNHKPYEKIQQQFGLNEIELNQLMRDEMGIFLFHMWRTRLINFNSNFLSFHSEEI